MKNNSVKTWKELLDFLDLCDSNGDAIYIKLPSMDVPIDNFEFMKIACQKDANGETFLSVEEDDDGNLYLS
jgi:hypothetical protein